MGSCDGPICQFPSKLSPSYSMKQFIASKLSPPNRYASFARAARFACECNQSTMSMDECAGPWRGGCVDLSLGQTHPLICTQNTCMSSHAEEEEEQLGVRLLLPGAWPYVVQRSRSMLHDETFW